MSTPTTLTSMISIHRYLNESRSSKGTKHKRKTMKAVQLYNNAWMGLKKRKKVTMLVLLSKLNKLNLSLFKMN